MVECFSYHQRDAVALRHITGKRAKAEVMIIQLTGLASNLGPLV